MNAVLSRESLAPRLRHVILPACLALAGCSMQPAYHVPMVALGDAYLHAPQGQWQLAQPAVAITQGWWQAFEDPGLNDLMHRMPLANPDLAQAQAQYRQARAALDNARSGLFPTVGAGSSVTRSGQGQSSAGNPATSYSLSASVNWEVDLWGRVRSDVAAARAGLQASQADLAGVQLSLQSTLAQAYIAVRSSELQDALLARTLTEYTRALEMTRNRYEAGVASPADVAAASSQLDLARVQRIRLSWQREQRVHAIAILLGLVPSAFQLPPGRALPLVPPVPAGVPSTLLQHRPDIAAAERRIAQANADIGIARAAWFPELTLSGQGGYRAVEFASWIMSPARFWTLGPALAATLFDGGARSAAVASAQAGYDVQAAAYRKTVLDAMREVEDALVQSQALVDEQQAQDRALAAARETLRQVLNQYQAGLVDYLSVVQAQTSALSAEQNDLDLRAQRLTASVLLVTALGGGWPGLEAAGPGAAEVGGAGSPPTGPQGAG